MKIWRRRNIRNKRTLYKYVFSNKYCLFNQHVAHLISVNIK